MEYSYFVFGWIVTFASSRRCSAATCSSAVLPTHSRSFEIADLFRVRAASRLSCCSPNMVASTDCTVCFSLFIFSYFVSAASKKVLRSFAGPITAFEFRNVAGMSSVLPSSCELYKSLGSIDRGAYLQAISSPSQAFPAPKTIVWKNFWRFSSSNPYFFSSRAFAFSTTASYWLTMTSLGSWNQVS